MKKSKIMKIISLITIISLFIALMKIPNVYAEQDSSIKVNLSNLTYTIDESENDLKKYTQDDFDTFLSDYNSGNLPEVYVTEFLFDGVSMVKTYDLDDFIEEGNDVEVKNLEITAINVNTTGNIEFSGEITGGMIAVDTNGKNGEINLILNGVNIDTDSKKTPAVYVYNKDITYTSCKVTIKTEVGSKNYIEGGKLKKVSLVAKDELESYTSKYSGESKDNYTSYSNYYGVYTSEQINNILFAKVQADNEDLADGDPYYFYKAAGAISSDIDLYFQGTGYLEVTSKNKEGIETKGNLTFVGGTGDYVIYAEDDCLNTTTDSSGNKSARNTLTIDVGSLIAVVDGGEDSDEGDAIDSNGTLVINGGTVVAIAHPGQDAGLDSENGTYINGGTVIATGDMYDAISSESEQNFIVLSFQSAQTDGTLITLLDEDDNVVMAYKTDRSYTNLVYSSPNLTEGTYYLYKDGEIEGTSSNGFYSKVNNYEKGAIQGYSSTGVQGGMSGGGMRDQMQNGDFDGEMPDRGMPSGEIPEDIDNEMNIQQDNKTENTNNSMRNRKNKDTQINGQDGKISSDEDMRAPEEGDFTPPTNEDFEDRQPGENGMMRSGNMQNSNMSAVNKEFTISGISNQFSGVGNYTEATEDVDETSEENENKESQITSAENSVKEKLSNPIVIGGIAVGGIIIVFLIVLIAKKSKKK